MTIFGNTNELERLVAREIELTNQRRELRGQIELAEKTAGEVLAEGPADRELGDLVRLREKLNALDLAVEAVRGRRPAAIAATFSEQVRMVRGELADKVKQLDSITARTSKLLRQLSEIEGVSYSDDILNMQQAGPGAFAGTRSDALRVEIGRLTDRAETLEGKGLPENGEIDLENVTDDNGVIKAVLLHPSRGPQAAAVMEFLASCAQSNRLPGRDFGNRPRRVRIQWTRGAIDRVGSYVYVRELAPKRESTAAYPIDAYDTDAATFRAA